MQSARQRAADDLVLQRVEGCVSDATGRCEDSVTQMGVPLETVRLGKTSGGTRKNGVNVIAVMNQPQFVRTGRVRGDHSDVLVATDAVSDELRLCMRVE